MKSKENKMLACLRNVSTPLSESLVPGSSGGKDYVSFLCIPIGRIRS